MIISVIFYIICILVVIIFVIKLYHHYSLRGQILRLYPRSNRVVRPTTITQLQEIIHNASLNGKRISIKGAGRSLGGQTYTADAIQIDMDNFNRILGMFDNTITVESGCKWKQVLDYLRPYNLSVEAMQSYSDFSVGGSLSVNCHGQDLNFNPIYYSTPSFRLLLSNNEIINVKSGDELFRLVIGGYGLFGIILDVTLTIIPNSSILKEVLPMNVADYASYLKRICNSDIMFHSGRLNLTEDWKSCLVINYKYLSETPNTQPRKQKKVLNEGFYLGLISNYSKLGALRTKKEMSHELSTDKIISRSDFLSASTASLESFIYPTANYVLQEYFIPFDHFASFVADLHSLVVKHDINLLNATFRYIKPHCTILSYCKVPSIAIVLYIDLDKFSSVNTIKHWTQQIISSALKHGGSYYLPYHLFATPEQFKQAYPNYAYFIRKKRQYDPTNIFMSHLWKFMEDVES